MLINLLRALANEFIPTEFHSALVLAYHRSRELQSVFCVDYRVACPAAGDNKGHC
jgi:hypothetical protein